MRAVTKRSRSSTQRKNNRLKEYSKSTGPSLAVFLEPVPNEKQIYHFLLCVLSIACAVAKGVPEQCKTSFRSIGRAEYDVSFHFFKKDNQLNPKDQAAVAATTRAAEEFLRQYDKAIKGKTNVPFGITGIEVRPIDEAPGKRNFSVQDGKIILGLKKNLLGQYIIETPQSIRDKWEKGEQFPRISLFKPNPMKRLWPFLNPVGTFRSALRTTLLNLRSKAQNRIEAASVTDLKELAKGKLDQWENAEIEKLRKVWAEESKGEAVIEDVLNAAIEKIARDQMPNYDLKLSSHFVNVGNIHDIDIGIRTGVGEIVGDGERPTVSVTSHGGFVNVFTIDRIHINLDLSNSLENAALLRAMARVREQK